MIYIYIYSNVYAHSMSIWDRAIADQRSSSVDISRCDIRFPRDAALGKSQRKHAPFMRPGMAFHLI